jgi:hypothetical protein
MSNDFLTISKNGKPLSVLRKRISGVDVVTMGKWLRIAEIWDEAYLEGNVVDSPEYFLREVKSWAAKPDIFTFSQKVPDCTPRYNYHFEWDNFAVMPITSYEDWLKNAKKDVKENLRRAKREGITVKVCEYTDEFVRGIKGIYDETPFRQGRPFWHYGKDFEVVKAENSTFNDRSIYLGAYLGEELIGFMKIVLLGRLAKTLHVLSMSKHYQKRPANAMIAKAVEVCAEKQITHLIYGQYEYPGKKDNSLTEFKARNGFQRFDFPKYYVPVTLKGHLLMACRLHLPVRRMIPRQLVNALLTLRSTFYKRSSLAGERS